MQGYVARKGDRFYAVIYEGTDPITGRERRRWHPAGTDRAAAEAIAQDLAERRRCDGHERCSLTLAVYLTQRWLPSKQLSLRASTYDSYGRNLSLHVIPRLGRVPLRNLRRDHFERLYAELLDDGRTDGTGGLNNKTVVEIHMILRRALDDAVRRGLLVSNTLRIAHAPKRRPLSSNTSSVWTAAQLQEFLTFCRTHRAHSALWVTANTGMRRGEVLGLRWGRRRPGRGDALSDPIAGVGRLLAPRDAGQVPHGAPLHQPRPRHRQRARPLARATGHRGRGVRPW